MEWNCGRTRIHFISTAGTATLAVIYLWPLARILSPAVVGNKIEFSVIYELSIFETNIIYQMTEGFTPDPVLLV